MKAKLCITCGGPPVASKENELYIQKMEEQNTRLKEEVSGFFFIDLYSNLY